MHTITFISPHVTVSKTAHAVIRDLGLEGQVQVVTAGLDRCLAIARQAERDGVHVIVARGWTADNIINADMRIPVVYIPLVIQDLAETLRLAQAQTGLKNPRIGLISFLHMHWDLAAFAELLGMNLHIYLSDSEQHAMEQAVIKAINDGTDIVVGGITSMGKAKSLGVPSAFLISGMDSVRQALVQASKIVYARKLEQTQAQKLRTVLDHSRDGIISVNAKGHILLTNPAAMRMLRLKNDPMHRHVNKILQSPLIDDCLQYGVAIQDKILLRHGTTLLLNMLPIRIKDELTGAILTLHERQSIAALESKMRRSADGLVALYTFDHIIGASSVMQATLNKARRYAKSIQSILITGETGTGKELFAHAIHSASPFQKGPFVAVNCGSLPPSLLESELFGYEAGAFTGATRTGKPGFFELAHEGTLFLDEIGELDMQGQTRLLRILEERSFMRLGGNRRIQVHLRIIAATNVDLLTRVQQGTFRQDLYYRLKVLTLPLPPLRLRENDVEHLVRHFLSVSEQAQRAVLCAACIAVLGEHTWPGNVRELRYTLDSLLADADSNNGGDSLITPQLIREALSPTPLPYACVPSPGASSLGTSSPGTSSPDIPSSGASSGDASQKTAQHQRESIIAALARFDGHQGKAAAHLNINRSTLYRQMKKYGIHKTLA